MDPTSTNVSGSGRTFRFIRLLAKGGFGEVYIAEMSSGDGFSKTVSVKLMRHDANDPELAQRMRDEARLLGRLRHPNIVQAEDLLTVGGRPAVVMEFIPGADLSVLLPEKSNPEPIPPRVAPQIVRQVSLALDAALNRPSMLTGKPLGVLHRDIKPANIRITPDGEVKVLDFGIARADNMSREAKTTDYQLGTLPYMAPEVLAGTPASHACDIYALGVTFYEIVGRKRFGWAGESADTHEYQLGGRLAQLETEAWGEHASTLIGLMKRMLSFEAELRPTAREVADECRSLEDAVGGARLDDWIQGALEKIQDFEASAEKGSLVGKVLSADTLQSQKMEIDGDSETIALPTDERTAPELAGPAEPTIALETGTRRPLPVEEPTQSSRPWISVGILVLVALGVFTIMNTSSPPEPLPTSTPIEQGVPEIAVEPPPEVPVPAPEAGPIEEAQPSESEEAEAPAEAPAPTIQTKPSEIKRPTADPPRPPEPTAAAPKTPAPQAATPGVAEPAPVTRGPLPVRIASVPFGVTVEVDGENVGRTPMRGIELSPGKHSLVFIDNGKRIEKEIHVQDGGRNLWTYRRADASIE
ncbi:MAG: protein kinase [Myxococcota bacterium]|nr:protein kinase [Myxococcota bacterium]